MVKRVSSRGSLVSQESRKHTRKVMKSQDLKPESVEAHNQRKPAVDRESGVSEAQRMERDLFYKMRLIPRLLILCFFMVALSAPVATAETQVKWTSATTNNGAADDQHPARTAPKSQRYWDEHNIPRPDYAKTDAEIAAERRKAGKQQFFGRAGATIFVVLLLVQIAACALVQWRGGVGGKRLGASTSGGGVVSHLFHHGNNINPEEEARRARLARFEQQQQAAGSRVNDHNNSKKED